MKEASLRFRLACSSPLLENTLCEELGPSGEGSLTRDILGSQEQPCNHQEVQEILELFYGSWHQSIATHIATEQCIEH